MTDSPRFSPRYLEHYAVRPARLEDRDSVERLLRYARLSYAALEWWTVGEWLSSPTCQVLTDAQDRPLALALTIADDSPIAWLRAVAANAEQLLAPLMTAAIRTATAQGCTALACLSGQSWLISQLEALGFRQVNRVIILQHNRSHPRPSTASTLDLRPATPADLEAIVAVDHTAFEPLWWYSRRTLQRALEMACCFHVAYDADHCVGYQFSTLRGTHGHLVRLATHPLWQRRGIGGRLLSCALDVLQAAGADEITVNTQQDNTTSQRLYHQFGFEPTGESWGVWLKSLTLPQAPSLREGPRGTAHPPAG